MQDQLSQIYLESVASSPAKKTDFNKKNTVGTVKEGDDFDAKKKGFQKGTGPDAQKKSFKKAKNLKEDADMNEQPIIGSQFDSLFNKTIKEDFEPADDSGEFGAPADSDMEFGGDEDETDLDAGEGEDEGGETDLRSALSGVIDQLQDILSNVEGGEGEGEEGGDDMGDIEDLEGTEDSVNTDEEDEDTVEEADAAMSRARDGKLSKAPDGKTTYQGPKKSNKVGGYFGKKTGSGATGDAGGSKPRDGRLRPAPGYKELQGKSNKVQSGVSSRTGASLFDS